MIDTDSMLEELKITGRRFVAGGLVYAILAIALTLVFAKQSAPLPSHAVLGAWFSLGFVVFGRNLCFGFGPPRFRVAASYLISLSAILSALYILFGWYTGPLKA